MCGVVGFHSKTPTDEHVALICRLFDESKIRGLHAFGATILKDGKLQTFKSFDVKDLKRWIRLQDRFETLIGHTRYSTSGDYNDHSNNQPIHVEDSSVVFNGVITQATKDVYQNEFGESYITDNDGEIFLTKFRKKQDWKSFVFDGRFSFAGIVMNNHRAYALRNKNRPLWFASRDSGNFIASTENIFKRSGFNSAQEIQPGVIHSLCTNS